jgi:uncharacterized short protein YbdD (DUF466 family)
VENVRLRFEDSFYKSYIEAFKQDRPGEEPQTKEEVFERKDEGYASNGVNNAFIKFCGKALRGEIK